MPKLTGSEILHQMVGSHTLSMLPTVCDLKTSELFLQQECLCWLLCLARSLRAGQAPSGSAGLIAFACPDPLWQSGVSRRAINKNY